MRAYFLVLPISLLVAYSQIIVKWRSGVIGQTENTGLLNRLLNFLADPLILSGYAAALIASFAWLYILTKLPLTIAFPIYIGVTFAMVLFGGYFFLTEALTATRLIAVLLIFAGIVLGITADE